MNTSELALLKQGLPFWDKLSNTQRNLLTQNATSLSYNAGSTIRSDQLECIGLLYVKTGTLRIYIMSENGREITLYKIPSGGICVLSASCILSSITFDVSIDALEDCELIQLSSSTFSYIMEENIYAEAFAYKMATERFSDVMWVMHQILFMSLDQRLAIFLLDETASLSDFHHTEDTLQMTHEQVARLMGSAREVVSRMLKYFADEGYVELSRGSIKIKNRQKLKELSTPTDFS